MFLFSSSSSLRVIFQFLDSPKRSVFHELGACSFCQLRWLRPPGSGKGQRTREDRPPPSPLSPELRWQRHEQTEHCCWGLIQLGVKQQELRQEKHFALKHGNGAEDTGQRQRSTWRGEEFHDLGAPAGGSRSKGSAGSIQHWRGMSHIPSQTGEGGALVSSLLFPLRPGPKEMS